MLGVYPFVSKKQERLAGRDKGRCLAHMFVMNVDEELEEWPESKERSRFWVRFAVLGSDNVSVLGFISPV
jgi:hypothetical protein